MLEPTFGIIPLHLVIPSTTNPRKRFPEGPLQELANSIKQQGVGQPILVRPLPDTEDRKNCVEIVAGERRYRASKLAGVPTIPAIVRTLTDLEARQFQSVENLQREDLHPIEEAEGFASWMKDFNVTVEKLIEETGKSRGYIYARLKLLDLCDQAKDAFFDSKIPASTALVIARIPVPSLQLKAAQEIIKNNGTEEPMSTRNAARLIQSRYMLNLSAASFAIDDAKLAPTAGSCKACPKRTGNQPEIYPDVRADICTDPDCFTSKTTAAREQAIAIVRKTKLPIYESTEAFLDSNPDDLVLGDSQVDDFERISDAGEDEAYSQVNDVLPAKLLPKVKAYALDDGKPVPIYEKSAIQEALEKAGLCLTIEQHAAAIQEKLTAPRNGENTKPPKANSTVNKIEAQTQIAAKETNFRNAVFLAVRQRAQNPLLTLRMVAKIAAIEWGASKVAAANYDFDINKSEQLHKYIDQATIEQLVTVLMDLCSGSGFDVSYYEIDNKTNKARVDFDFQVWLDMAASLDIDVLALRAEHFPPDVTKERKAVTKKTKAKKSDTDKDEPQKTAPVTKKILNSAHTPDELTAAWPFPRGVQS